MKRGNERKYPVSKQINQVDNFFGKAINDPYRWLEDADSLDTNAWVEAQNKFTEDLMQEIPCRNFIKKRITSLYNHNKISLPYKVGDNYFMYKQEGLENHKSYYIKRVGEDAYEKLIDVNTLSKDGSVSLVFAIPSKDGKYVAYAISRSGTDWREFFVIDLETGEQLKDHIKKIKFSRLEWYKDGFYYSKYFDSNDETIKSRYNNVFYHKIGTNETEDILIYQGNNDEIIGCAIQVSNDEKYLFLYSWLSSRTNIVSYRKIGLEAAPFKPILSARGYYYSIEDNDEDGITIFTNYKASKFRFSKILFNNKEPENWIDIIAEPTHNLRYVYCLKDVYLVHYLVDLIAKINIYNKKGQLLHQVEMPGNGTVKEISTSYSSNEIFFQFESYLHPLSIYKCDTLTNKTTLYKRVNINFNSTLYESKRVFYTSKDGTKIPLFINYKKGIKLDGTNPTVLCGYGGFNKRFLPEFDVSKSFFLEQGGIYAVASIRGGGEYGSSWHKAGTLANKQNVFDDFIAAAKYLINKKYTNSNKLAIIGRSNGGLLIGAVTNQQPNLFKVAVPVVGVLDMLRYHKFTVGNAWIPEYGCSDIEAQFNYLVKYSPLHNIEAKKYPAVMVVAAKLDDRVLPAHSYKYIATLQQHQKSNLPAIIKIQTKAAHGTYNSTGQLIEQWTDIWSFVMHHLDMQYNLCEN